MTASWYQRASDASEIESEDGASGVGTAVAGGFTGALAAETPARDSGRSPARAGRSCEWAASGRAVRSAHRAHRTTPADSTRSSASPPTRAAYGADRD